MKTAPTNAAQSRANAAAIAPPPPAKWGLVRGAFLSAVAALFLAAAAPAEAQTVSFSATGSGGDRDTTAAGLQVDEGDTITLTITANGLTAGRIGATWGLAASGTAVYSNTDTGGDFTGNFDVFALDNRNQYTEITAPATTAQFTFTITDDSAREDAETIVFSFGVDPFESSTASPATFTNGSDLTVTIRASDPFVRTLTVTCNPASVAEGASATCTINIGAGDTAFTNPTAVMWEVTHGDTAAADFAAATSGSVMFPTTTTFAIATADDNLDEDAEAFTVQISVADDTADMGTAFGAAASVSITDNDEAGVVIAPTALSVPQNGMAEYTVRLATQPVDNTAMVTVTIGGAGSTVTVAPTTPLTFTAATWNTPQTVTVTATETAMVDDPATLTHAVTVNPNSGEYASVANVNLAVTIIARATAQATHELLLPEVTRAVVGEVFGAIAERAGGVGGQIDGGSGFSLNGQSNWSDIVASQAGALAAGGVGIGDGNGDIDIDAKKLISGLEFARPLSAGASHGGGHGRANLAFWGGGDYRDFSGEDGDDDWDGSVFSMRFGVDGAVRENLRAGLMLSYSDAETEYTVGGDTVSKGDYELDLTSVSPYFRWNLGGGHAWASVSYGSGEVEVKPDSDDASTHDVTMTGAAFGGERKLLEQNGRELSLRADAFIAESEVEGDGDADSAGIDDDLDADANRLRVALAWSYPGRFAAGLLSPAFDLGLRHDGGDGRTGAGLELGGALRYRSADAGVTVEGNARALLGHSGDHRGWGIGGLMRIQNGADGQGLAVSVAPGYGDATVDSGALWNAGVAAAGRSIAKPSARLDAEVGYGLPAESGLFTPYSALQFGDANRATRLGLRWTAARIDLDIFARHAADNTLAIEGRLKF